MKERCASPSCDGPSNWTAQVKASTTALTRSIDMHPPKYSPLPSGGPGQDPFQRAAPARSPALFAVRAFGKGRVAILAQWHQYTIGSGMDWLFDSQVHTDNRVLAQELPDALEWLWKPMVPTVPL